MKSISKFWVGLALVCGCAACGSTKKETREREVAVSTQIDVQQLALDIDTELQFAARRIQTQTKDREVRRQMIVWQIHCSEALRHALLRPDPRWAFEEIWMLLLRTKAYVAHGFGSGKLGHLEPILVAALDALIARVERHASTFLSTEQFDAVKSATRKWASEHPIGRASMSDTVGLKPETAGAGLFDAVTAVPEGVFSFGGGVKATAVSLSDVATAADRGVEVVSSLPLQLRWQTELLLYTIEEHESVAALLADFSRVSESVATIAHTAEGLPERVDQAIGDAGDKLEAAQPGLQRALDTGQKIVVEARATMNEITPLLDRVQENGDWLERTSVNTTQAGKAWEGAFGQLNLLVNPPVDPGAPPPEPSPPFDMRDVARTAEHATTTAAELHATVRELRGIIEGRGFDERLGQVDTVTQSALAGTSALARDLVDRIAGLAALLMTLFFGLLLGYRFVAHRIARRA